MPSSSNFNYNIVTAEYTELGDVAPVPTPDLCFEFPVLVKLPTRYLLLLTIMLAPAAPSRS